MYSAYILPRGGQGKSWQLKWSALSWGRVLNEISDASVSIGIDGLSDDALCQTLAGIEEWTHELAIERDEKHVWVGPVTSLQWSDGVFNISAKDMFAWLERRFALTRGFLDEDLAVIFRTVADDALRADNSMRIEIEHSASPQRVAREIKGDEHPRAADTMRGIARSGLDWTTMLRKIRVGVLGFSAVHLGTLIRSDVMNPVFTSDGQTVATHVVVRGDRGGADSLPVSGEAVENGFAGGLIQTTFDEPGAKDEASARLAAQNHLALVRRPPISLTAQLHPDSPIGVEALIPGYTAHIDMTVGPRHVKRDMRLQRVSATVNEKAGETVTVEFGPVESATS